MNNRKIGIASLILGFCSMYIPCCNVVTAILAIVFGSKAKKTPGENLGTIGKLLGIFTLVSIVVSTIIIIFTITLIVLLEFLVLYLELYAL